MQNLSIYLESENGSQKSDYRPIDQSESNTVGINYCELSKPKDCVHDTETSLHATQYDSNPMQIDLQGALGLFILK